MEFYSHTFAGEPVAKWQKLEDHLRWDFEAGATLDTILVLALHLNVVARRKEAYLK